MKRHIKNSVNYLRWSFFKKIVAIYYWSKKFHLRYFTRFLIHLLDMNSVQSKFRSLTGKWTKYWFPHSSYIYKLLILVKLYWLLVFSQAALFMNFSSQERLEKDFFCQKIRYFVTRNILFRLPVAFIDHVFY